MSNGIIHLPELSITKEKFLEIYKKHFKKEDTMDFVDKLKNIIKESIEQETMTKQYVLTMIENAFDLIEKDDIIVYDPPQNRNVNFIITMPKQIDMDDIGAGIAALEDKDILGDKFAIEKSSPRILNISIPKEYLSESLMTEENKVNNDSMKNFIKVLGSEFGIDLSKYDIEELLKGFEVEKEHGTRDMETNVTDDDPVKTLKIALAHLNEIPDYYTKLAKYVENGGTKEGLKEEKKKWKYNPWAVCTDNVGREDKEKYEKCVKGVKKSQIDEEIVSPVKNKMLLDKDLVESIGEKNIDSLKEFLLDCCDELNINEPIKVCLKSKRGGPITTTASYNTENHDVFVYAKGRHIIDVMRSCAHELKHMDQNLKGELTSESGKDGSPHENEAHAFSGFMIRKFGKKYPNIYE